MDDLWQSLLGSFQIAGSRAVVDMKGPEPLLSFGIPIPGLTRSSGKVTTRCSIPLLLHSIPLRICSPRLIEPTTTKKWTREEVEKRVTYVADTIYLSTKTHLELEKSPTHFDIHTHFPNHLRLYAGHHIPFFT